MSWNILSPLIFCVKSTLQYFSCTQQLHTGGKSQILNQPTEKSVFLPANLSNDARIQEQHLSITFECGLSASSLGAERNFIFGIISTCWEATHGGRDIGAGHRREIKVRETENSLWKKVYLSLRKQTKSKAGHRCSKSAKWWSNCPLLHCLWQTLQVHFSSPGKHQKVPREDQFCPDLFYLSLLGRVYCSFSVFVVPDDSAILLAIIFLPLL